MSRYPPPSNYNQPGYNSQGYIRDVGLSSNYTNFQRAGQKRKSNYSDTDDSYFDDVDDFSTVEDKSSIIDANPFLSEEEKKEMKRKQEEDEEDDPLDAFMAGINSEVKNLSEKKDEKKGKELKGVRADVDELDDEELYYKYMEENPDAGKMFTEGEEGVEYDEDGNEIPSTTNKKNIDPLPVVYHSQIDYKPFNKNFYTEHDEINSMNLLQIIDLRHKLNIKVQGNKCPKPVSSFAHFGFPEKLISSIRKQNFVNPTPIQAQAIPCAVSGRDVIGIAQTGSGKTTAFLWPLLIHILDQAQLKKDDGPIGVIITPTRELCQQIHQECRKFGKAFNIKTACCFGGGNMYEQQKSLKSGCEIVVATPGRLIDHIKKSNTNLLRTTYLVFDEADRMFEMGFEYQVRSIAGHVRPDRQTLLFSATFRHRIEKLARDVLIDPIRITQGDIGVANTDVTQTVQVFSQECDKWRWLTQKIVQFTSEGSLLIFVTKKLNAEELSGNLKKNGYDVTLIHGDMNQYVRNDVIASFKKRQVATLVATDVAARGLDIPHIKNVVNYDVARDIDTHTHRVGRTGRAGEKGNAYTLVTNKDIYFAGDLVRHLEAANQVVPQQLLDIAKKNSKFNHGGKSGGKHKNILNTKERPGLGATNSSFKKPSRAQQIYQSGVLGGRASSVKDYFNASYQKNFVSSSASSSNETWNSGSTTSPGGFKHPASMQAPVQKKKKKSRWGN